MNFLFIHQNFPGQYVHAARHLAQAGHRVVFLTQEGRPQIAGIRKIEYPPPAQVSPAHPYIRELEVAVQNGLAVARLCDQLKRDGFTPDIAAGHNGWGETLYVKDVWPSVPLLGYFEWFYRAVGSDTDCDPEFPPRPDDALRLRTRNSINLLGLDAADWGQTPTEWQRSQYPRHWWERISVIHEGVDSEQVRPDPTARIWLRSGLSLSRAEEVITYCARNLEPYRGFHTFMRALPEILRRRPEAQVLIAGGDGVSYGRAPAHAPNWRGQLMAELEGQLDLRRVHFVGRLPYHHYLSLLQLSSVHVYLTYPFVLSWSLIEAMSAGCLVVASRTPPVEEVLRDGQQGYLVDLLSSEELAERLVDVLRHRDRQDGLRAAARAAAVGRYDLISVCLPRYLALLDRLIGGERPV